jgi:hypothetical protein
MTDFKRDAKDDGGLTDRPPVTWFGTATFTFRQVWEFLRPPDKGAASDSERGFNPSGANTRHLPLSGEQPFQEKEK